MQRRWSLLYLWRSSFSVGEDEARQLKELVMTLWKGGTLFSLFYYALTWGDTLNGEGMTGFFIWAMSQKHSQEIDVPRARESGDGGPEEWRRIKKRSWLMVRLICPWTFRGRDSQSSFCVEKKKSRKKSSPGKLLRLLMGDELWVSMTTT